MDAVFKLASERRDFNGRDIFTLKATAAWKVALIAIPWRYYVALPSNVEADCEAGYLVSMLQVNANSVQMYLNNVT
jgi:hypothetical protein